MEIIEKLTCKVDQVVIMMVILVILMNITMKIMVVIYHGISF